MTVYFTASIVGKKHYLPNYLKIIEILKSKGFQVISNHIITTNELQIRMEKREDRIKFQNKLEKWIKSCGFVVAETSFPSISVGYEISLAQHFGKPVLILYSDNNPPSLLVEHKDEKVVCEEYTSDKLPEIISEFLSFIEELTSTKFTFFITSEMASFLDKISIREKIPKSVYLRRLISRQMKTSA